ncbi:YfiR family protein [Phenylobacterium deserti]|nr:YfiR family protein [Phenylobacterium deserti]
MAFALAAGGAAPAGAQPSDAAIKAAFITKFPAFVQGLPDGAPLNVCIVGPDSFGSAIERSAAVRVVVRRLAVVTPTSGCHVVYATGGARQSVRDALAIVAGAPVLTITDGGAGPTRGMIHFVVAGERVRFHVDTLQASRSHLQLSSKLLALALSVRQ